MERCPSCQGVGWVDTTVAARLRNQGEPADSGATVVTKALASRDAIYAEILKLAERDMAKSGAYGPHERSKAVDRVLRTREGQLLKARYDAAAPLG